MELLYQYTSVDALESILRNKTIRFRPLSTMDDLQEEVNQDSKRFGSCVFSSSWSSESKEMIPMWKMYGDDFKGVRIALPPNPFREYYYSAEEFSKYASNPDNLDIVTNIPLEDVTQKSFTVTPYRTGSQLKKIEYVDDITKLEPELWSKESKIDGDRIQNFDVWSYGKLGIYKNTYWEFQKEYRYLLYIFPVSMIMMSLFLSTQSIDALKDIIIKISNGEIQHKLEYYDMKISEKAMNKMEIVLGVKISDEDRKRVYTLINDINPQIKVYESALNGLLRKEKI